MNVVIVEDDFLIALDLQMQLEDLKQNVIGIATDLASCQELLEKRIPDLAFMDLRLANGESGEEVAGWLFMKFNVRSVFVSGNLDQKTRERLEAFNPVAFVGKPVLPNLIADVVANIEPSFL